MKTDFAKDQNKTEDDLQMSFQCRSGQGSACSKPRNPTFFFVSTPDSADEPIKMVHFFIYGGVMLPISIAFLVIICMGLR